MVKGTLTKEKLYDYLINEGEKMTKEEIDGILI
jgi:hypothetical protein